jgi:transglutaminase-like putative cysteine protease
MLRCPTLLFVVILLCVSAAAAAAESRRIAIAYEVTIDALPSGATRVDVFLPLPAEDEDQAVETYRVRSELVGEVEREAVYGNRFWRARLPAPSERPEGPVVITLEATIERQLDSHIVPTSARALDEAERAEHALFLNANERVVVGHEILDPILAEVRARAGSEDKAVLARAIYDWVVDNVEYKKIGSGWGNGDTFWACNERYGNCTDFHALFISLARTLGIPARFEMGFPVPADRARGEIAGYHCWVEFYLPGAGWLPIDASEAAKHPEKRELFYGTQPTDRLHFTTGRDLRLGEHHADTRSLNYFIYPYVEIDGKRYDGKIATKVTYADLGSVEVFGP